MRARRARTSDAARFLRLIAEYAAQGLLLPRAEEEIRQNISHFLVQEDKKRVVSCVALESYGADLAEIRSLAVRSGNSRAAELARSCWSSRWLKRAAVASRAFLP